MNELKSVLKKLGWSDELADAFVSSDVARDVVEAQDAPAYGPTFHDVANMTLNLDNFSPPSWPRT
jgi:hypothetical protein